MHEWEKVGEGEGGKGGILEQRRDIKTALAHAVVLRCDLARIITAQLPWRGRRLLRRLLV